MSRYADLIPQAQNTNKQSTPTPKPVLDVTKIASNPIGPTTTSTPSFVLPKMTPEKLPVQATLTQANTRQSRYADLIPQAGASNAKPTSVSNPNSRYADLVPSGSNQYFGTTTPRGEVIGYSTEEKDPSGKPYLAYRNPGDTATTTDYTRIATKFDPRTPQKTTRDSFYNPRFVENKDALRLAMGGAYSDELDHKIAVALAGSNNPKNLRPVPASENTDSPIIQNLQQKVINGEMSLFEAQVALAKAKGIDIPWTPKEARDAKRSVFGDFLGKVSGVWKNTVAPAIEKATTAPAYKPGDSVLKDAFKLMPSTLVETLAPGVKAIRQEPETAANIKASDIAKNLPKATAQTVGRMAAEFYVAPALTVFGAIRGAATNDPTKAAVSVYIPGIGDVNSKQMNAVTRIDRGENPYLVAAEEGIYSVFDTLMLYGVVRSAFSPRQVTVYKENVTATPKVNQSVLPETAGGKKVFDAGPRSFRSYQKPVATKFIPRDAVEQMKIEGIPFNNKFDPSRPTFIRYSGIGKGNLVRGEVVQLKPSIADSLFNRFTKSPTTNKTYFETAIKNSQADDIDRAIKAGEVPKEAVYKQGKVLTPEFAQGRVDDIAMKLDMYQPGLGKQFRGTIDINNSTMNGLVDTGEMILKNAGVFNTPANPAIVNNVIAAKALTLPETSFNVQHKEEVDIDSVVPTTKPTEAVQAQTPLEGAKTPQDLINEVTAPKQEPTVPATDDLAVQAKQYDSLDKFAEAVATTKQSVIPFEDKPFVFSYVRNTSKSPNKGTRFGQDIEPAGKYMTVGTPKSVQGKSNMESGTLIFKKPLVIEFGGGYEEASNWKKVLSERFDNKTGAELSRAIQDAGYDGIVTVSLAGNDKYTSEIVSLSPSTQDIKNIWNQAQKLPVQATSRYADLIPKQNTALINKQAQIRKKLADLATEYQNASPEDKPAVLRQINKLKAELKKVDKEISTQKALQGVSKGVKAEKPTETREKLVSTLKEEYMKLGMGEYNMPKAEEALGQILIQLDLAERGQRIATPSSEPGINFTWTAKRSTFPEWIPEGSRSRVAINDVMQYVDSIEALKFPTNNQSVAKARFINSILNQVDGVLDIDTKAIRNDILKTYEKTAKEGDVTKGEETTSEGVSSGAERNGKGEIDPEEIAFKAVKIKGLPEDKNLIVQHNISEEKLRHTLKMGGLPVPSIAISRKEFPLEGFGEITLIGDSNLIDPTTKTNKVFNADAYSKRYPRLTYKYDNLTALQDVIDKGIGYIPESEFAAWRGKTASSVASGMEDDGIRTLRYSDRVKAGFAAINKLPKFKTISELDDAIRTNYKSEYEAFVSDLYDKLNVKESIFKGFTASGKRKYVDHNLDNVVAEMRGAVKDTEGFSYGLPSLRASQAKSYRSIDAIKKDRNKIVSNVEMEKVKDDFDTEFNNLLEKNKVDDYSDFISILKDYLRGQIKYNELKDYPATRDVDMTEFVEFAQRLKDAPTEYFEAKPQRAVKLEEFKAVVVPKTLSSNLKKSLNDKGLKVVEYDSKIEGDRALKIRTVAESENIAFKQVNDLESFNDLIAVEEAQKQFESFFSKNEVELLFWDKPKVSENGSILLGQSRTIPAKMYELPKYVVEVAQIKPGMVSRSTLRHEAVHAYLKVAYTKDERARLFRRVKRLSLVYRQGDYGRMKEYNTADKRAEEFLADDFDSYVESLGGKKVYKGFLADIWDRMIKYFKDLLRRYTGAKNLYDEMLNRRVPKKELSALQKKVGRQGGYIKIPDIADRIARATEAGAKKMREAADRANKQRAQREEAGRDLPIEESLIEVAKSSMDPLRGVDPTTRNIFRNWNINKIQGVERARIVARDYRDLPRGMQFIHDYQAGKRNEFTDSVKQAFDSFRDEFNKKGMDIDYIENYLPQKYSNSAAEFQQAALMKLEGLGLTKAEALDYINQNKRLPSEKARRLKLTPTFERERFFKDYKEAEQYGLNPEYTNAGDLLTYYVAEGEKALANRNLVSQLEEAGKILGEGQAPLTWSKLNPQFVMTENYRAPGPLARIINNLFRDTNIGTFSDKFFGVTAKTSQKLQEITLSAGVPKTNFNFFSTGQLIKEITAGNLGAVKPYLRANSDVYSMRYFEDKENIIRMMGNQNIDLTGRLGGWNEKTFKELVDSKQWRRAIGTGFDKLFNEKTFKSFLPMMQIDLFEKVYLKAKNNGYTETEAQKLAGNIVKNNFGLFTDSFARSQLTNDVMSTFFFAPRFRESIIRVITNTMKAGYDFGKNGFKNGNPNYSRNLRLLGGIIATVIVYQILNKAINDKYTWQNPDGREFALRIPTDNGKVLYIEMMPGFLAFPRMIGTGALALTRGDFQTAIQRFGGLLSTPIKLITDILGNEDYFGREIYKQDDSGTEKATKIALYLGLNANHPYVREIVNFIKAEPTDRSLLQSLSIMAELPLKFSTLDKEAKSAMYKRLQEVRKVVSDKQDQFMPTYEEIKNLEKTNKTEANLKKRQLSDEDWETYKSIERSEKAKATAKNKGVGYRIYEQVQDLKLKGDNAEAQLIIKGLNEEDYKAYSSIKKQLE